MITSSRIAARVRDLPPSGIRQFFDLVAARPGAISLGIGEPDFVTPWHIREAGIHGLEKGHTHYTANRGLPSLRAEIAGYLQARCGLRYDPETEILVTVGVSEALDVALRAILEPGDAVIIPEPCFVAYNPCVVLAGGRPVTVATSAATGFKLTSTALAAADPAKALLLGYPNNPTGAVLARRDWEPLARVAIERGMLLISDEIYAELTYDHEHFCPVTLPGMQERSVLLGGFSKAFAMTGWRLGYAVGPADIIEAMVKIHTYTIMSPPTMAQEAALEALRAGSVEVRRMVNEYNQRRRVMVKRLNDMGLTCFEPKGAFYTFPSIVRTGLSSQEFAERLLEEEQVAVVPGTAFGECGEGHVRCAYATSMSQLEEALARMARFTARLQGE